MIDILIVIILYLVVLLWTGRFALRAPIISDRYEEYIAFQLIGKYGGWKENIFRKENTVIIDGKSVGSRHEEMGSCLFSTYIPYAIAKLFRIDETLVFKILPSFIYAMMPMFTYLIARQYLNVSYSLIAVLFVISNFYFLYYSNIGRVGIAFGFASGMFWALLSGHILLASVFAVLVVLSHYGTTFQVLYIMGVALPLTYFLDKPSLLGLLIVFLSLFTAAFVWHGIVVGRARVLILTFLKRTLTLSSPTLTRPMYEVQRDGTVVGLCSGEVYHGKGSGSLLGFFKIGHREMLLQMASGKAWPSMKFPQRLEFVLSWLLVFSVVLGLGLALMNATFPLFHKAIAIAMFSSIIISVLLPHLSVWYGVGRPYLLSLLFMASYAIVFISWLSGLLNLNGYIISVLVIVLYASCVSGLFHRLCGVRK